MLRLTKSQMMYLTELQNDYGVKRGTYLRRLLIIDMLKRERLKSSSAVEQQIETC